MSTVTVAMPPPDSTEQQIVRATHRLAGLVRNMRASPETLARVHGLLSEIRDLLEPEAWAGPYAVEQLSPPGDGRLVYEADDLARTVPYSPMLGARNPISPEVEIHAEDGAVRGRIRFDSLHAGPINTVHGGAVSALFDEILALANIVKGQMGFTRSISVKFLKPTPLGVWLEFRAECTGLDGKTLTAEAEIRDDGQVTASASGSFKAVFSRTDDPYALKR